MLRVEPVSGSWPLPGPRTDTTDTLTRVITGDLKSKIDRVWDAFWSGGISNPLEVIEQITYLLFTRRLDDLQTLAEKATQEHCTSLWAERMMARFVVSVVALKSWLRSPWD